MRILLILFIIIPVSAFCYQIRGRVFRSDSRSAVPSATVILKSGTNVLTAAQAEDNGSFILETAAGMYSLSAGAVGYYQETKDINLKSDISINFYIIPQSSLSLGEVQVTGEKLKGTESKNVISKDLRNKAPDSITGDPVHSLTLMPGVSDLGIGNTFNNTKLSVRGGTGNENAALLDDALIQYPYHHFIGDSVFIDEIVDGIDIYKGVLPARYGQSMSSLLQVNMIEGEPGFHGKVDLGLINTYAAVSGASEDQKWNFAGGIRRTQYDLILPFFVQGVNGIGTNFHAPYYLDSHGRIQYKDGGDVVSLVWLFSEEPTFWTNSSFTGRNATNSGIMDYYDGLINLNWKHSFSREWSIDQSIGFMGSYQDLEMNEPDNTTLMRDSAYNLRYKGLVSYTLSENISFDVGGEVIYFPGLFYTNYCVGLVTNQVTGHQEWLTFGNNSYNGALGIYSPFIENESDFFDKKFYIQDGIRFNYVDYIKKYSFDPRLTIGYRFAESKIYASAGLLSEFPSDSFDVSILDTNSSLNIPGCWHYILGTELNFNRVYCISLEGYFKNYINYLSEESNTQFLLQTTGEKHQVFGIDLLLTKKKDGFPVYGWISISGYYARGYRDYGVDPNTLCNLNPGSVMGGPSVTVLGQYANPPMNEWFEAGSLPYKVDLTAIWEINKNWSLTSEFQWQSGGQYTPLVSVRTNIMGNNTLYTPVWGRYNSAWLPDVHSLNLKLEYTGKLWDFPAGIDLQVNNVYNYRPVTYISYADNYSTKVENQSPIGIYPSLDVWMKW